MSMKQQSFRFLTNGRRKSIMAFLPYLTDAVTVRR